MSKPVKVCPFCGESPSITPWHGGTSRKRAVQCCNEKCFVAPMVTGPGKQIAIERWNLRINSSKPWDNLVDSSGHLTNEGV